MLEERHRKEGQAGWQGGREVVIAKGSNVTVGAPKKNFGRARKILSP